MLKIRDLQEVPELFELLSHPKVYPYVREKASTTDEYYFLTKKTIEAEERGELISRTITDEYCNPIGTINLYDIENNYGFLATWIGQPYFGKGYNQLAKEHFLDELFFDQGIEAVFMKIRKTNKRSLGAVQKLPYAILGNELYESVYNKINAEEEVYELYVVTKALYEAYKQFSTIENVEISSNDEDVS